jgi:tetrahydromethanopterin S-methyltransferase subunit B
MNSSKLPSVDPPPTDTVSAAGTSVLARFALVIGLFIAVLALVAIVVYALIVR